MWKTLVILTITFQNVLPQRQEFFTVPDARVGGIFDERMNAEIQAFNASTKRANGNVKLQPKIKTLNALDSYSVQKTACLLEDVVAVLGPQAAAIDGVLSALCAKTHVPYLQAAWQPPPEPQWQRQQEEICANVTDPCYEENLAEHSRCCFVPINLYPSMDEVAHAFADTILSSGWSTFTILYDDDFGLMRVQKILSTLASLTPVRKSNTPILVRRLIYGENNQVIFKELNVLHESRVLLDCHVDRVVDYLRAANDSNMLNDYQAFILTTLEVNSINQQLLDFKANISWLSMYKVEDRRMNNDILTEEATHWFTEKISTMSIKLETLLVADVANHLSTAISHLKNEIEEKQNGPPNVCSNTPWKLGPSLQMALVNNRSFGYSGVVEFNQQGMRKNYQLHLHKMLNGQKPDFSISWESATRSFNESTKAVASEDTARWSKTFKVIAKLVVPYFSVKKNAKADNLEGNNRYEGYAVDLITAIFNHLNDQNKNTTTKYEFEFIEPPQGQNIQGSFDKNTKQWSGLIGALLSKEADLAICDMTITEERKQVVDFSVPFMTLGISILFTKEKQPEAKWLSFLDPYSVEVWLYTATAYLVVSIVLFISSRISPGDWENPQPCEKDPEELENIWNFKNCTWLTMGSIMTQGCDILPKAIGSRWVCGMWWFFAMIVCQTYIAQLAASLTSALVSEPIKNVEELANQRKIEYGCQAEGSTAQFFSRSKDKMFEKMWLQMNTSRPSPLCKDNDEGARRVERGKNRFAFFMESTTIEYKKRRNCDLIQVGNLLDSKDYGIAMPSNSIHRTAINTAILSLQSSGALKEIKTEWWERRNIDGKKECTEKKDEVEGDLEMSNLMGAFLVLIVGCVFSIIIAAFEFLDHIRNIVISERITHKEAFMAEIKACLNLTKLQKPVLGKSSPSPSQDGESERGKTPPRVTATTALIEDEKMRR